MGVVMHSEQETEGLPRRFRPFTTQTWDKMTLLFKAFADPTRLRILHTLFDGERSVSDIARAVQLSPSAVSHQLSLLRLMRLVRSRRDGRTVYYTLDDDHVHTLFEQGLEHVSHD